MALDTLTPDDIKKLNETIKVGIEESQKMADIKDGLRDLVKNVAKDLNIKPKVLNQAIKAAFKQDINVAEDELEDVKGILIATKRL